MVSQHALLSIISVSALRGVAVYSGPKRCKERRRRGEGEGGNQSAGFAVSSAANEPRTLWELVPAG